MNATITRGKLAVPQLREGGWALTRDFVGELNAKAVAAFYRHLTREHLGRAQRARFERTAAWAAGDDLEGVPA